MPRYRWLAFTVIALGLVTPIPLTAQSIEEQMRAMQQEILQLRQELNALRQEVRGATDASEPAPVEALPLMQAQIQEHAQTKVESTSKFPMRLFGTIVSNTFWNTGEANWLDIPNIVTPEPAGARNGSFSSSLRQTRIGAALEGPQIGSMRSSGLVAIDFSGGVPAFQTGQVMGLPRLLYAYMRLDGERSAIQIGQDHMIFAPKNPTTIQAMAFPALYRSGNLYLRAPQMRVEHMASIGAASQFRIISGIMAPVAGDFGNTGYQFVPPNLSGEQSRLPGLQTRVALRATPPGPYEQPQWEFGLSGHYSKERVNAATTVSWAAAVDFDATAGRFGFGRELFSGKNMDAFGGSLGQVNKSHGGFLEVRLSATPRLNFNAGYGTDQLRDPDRFPSPLERNASTFANTIYQFTPEVEASFEYRWLATRPASGSLRTNNHFNLTFAYSF